MIEAMKQALEALEELHRTGDTQVFDMCYAPKVIPALRQAIEQAEKQEPRCAVIVEVFGKDWRLDYMSLPVGKHKLYTQQYVYTTPPQRTWVGLTDEEIIDVIHPLVMADMADEATDYEIARAIEAKLKEKNT
jgi:hypothetical protein